MRLALFLFIILLAAMEKEGSRPTINMELVKKLSPKMDEAYLTDPASTYLSAKRRKSKVYSTRKTNEQLIKQSHEDLLNYINGVDHKVQAIIQTHQAQFLTAYQRHIKKVREEMEEIRAQSLSNANSEKAYLDKIDCLEKELVIFRDQALKLFGKIISKDKEIFDLNIKVKELAANIDRYEKSIYILTKRNKQLQVFIARMRQRYGQNMLTNEIGMIKRDIRSQNKRYEMSTPNSKDALLSCQRKHSQDMRPFTSAKTTNAASLVLRLQSNKKQDAPLEISHIRQKLEEHTNSKIVNVEAVMRIAQEKHDGHINKSLFANSSPTQHRMYSKQKRRSTFRVIEDEIVKLKSQQFAQKNEYMVIFKNCVQMVKKQIIRRNNIPSLNYFKQNGPKSYIEFKKIDYYNILQLLLKNDTIMAKIYDMIFNSTFQ